MNRKIIAALALLAVAPLLGGADSGGCEEKKTSDSIQREQQEVLLREGTSQIGMPAIKNFRERKLLKDIFELRDQSGLITYTYLYVAMTGKLVFFCDSIGYGIPYATQFTSPGKPYGYTGGSGVALTTVPQADPNGLFSPASADGTWVMCKDPSGKDVRPVYIEPHVIVSPFKLPQP
jgi:hypothetical protein